jgi:hypothetical protein
VAAGLCGYEEFAAVDAGLGDCFAEFFFVVVGWGVVSMSGEEGQS